MCLIVGARGREVHRSGEAGGRDEEGVSQARVRLKVRSGWLRDGPGMGRAHV